MNSEGLISRFLEYVRIDSISSKEGNFASVLKEALKEIGFEVFVDNAHILSDSNTGNIIGHLKGNKNVPSIMFGAHMDTVVPGENINPIIVNGIIKSDGKTILGADDKAGIVAILEGIKHIKENNIPHGDIEVVFTICEETGLLGAKYLDYSKINSKMAFILDSSGDVGNVIVQGPAQIQIAAKIYGKAAHAGLNPEKGINSIQVAAKAIDNMNLLRIDEETTANVGIIKGGSATNIVCDYIEMELECRSLNKEKLSKQSNHMVECVEKAGRDFAAKVDIEIDKCYPVFSISKDEPILNIMEKSIKDIGLAYCPRSTGGGSDTNILNGKGIKAVTLGIGMFNAHSTEEYIAIDSIINAAKLVSSIIQNV